MKFSNPETQQLFDDLARNTREMIEVPNSWLPECYQNHRDGGRTLQELEDMYQRDVEPKIQRNMEKVAKAARVEMYRQQWEANPDSPLTYDVDEDRLYEKQLTFVGAMVQAGVIEIDDKF